MEIKGGDGSTNRPQGRDLDETSGSGSMGSHSRDGLSRGRGLEREREQEPSERKAASQGVDEGPKSVCGGVTVSITQGTQPGRGHEVLAWCPSGGDIVLSAAGEHPGGGEGSRL